MRDVDAFKKHTWILVVLAVVVGGSAAWQNARGAFRRIRAEERAGKEKRRQKSLVAALAEISEEVAGVSFAQLGASVFVAKKRWRHAGRLVFVHEEQLRRVERFRVTDVPQPSMVAWVAGKGVIGKVLRTRTTEHKHWAPIAKMCKNGPLSEAQFQALSADDRSNFTYNEFVGIASKYAEVLAVPIMSDTGGKLVGVLSLDRKYEGDSRKLLKGDAVKGIAEATAVALRADL